MQPDSSEDTHNASYLPTKYHTALSRIPGGAPAPTLLCCEDEG